MQDESSRNTIIFLVCAVFLFFIYQHFVLDPAAARRQAEMKQAQAAAAAKAEMRAGAPAAPTVGGEGPLTRGQALAASPRVAIATPSLKGSIALKGARIDDLWLTQFRQTVDRSSPPVELLRPEGAQHAWFAEFG